MQGLVSAKDKKKNAYRWPCTLVLYPPSPFIPAESVKFLYAYCQVVATNTTTTITVVRFRIQLRIIKKYKSVHTTLSEVRISSRAWPNVAFI